MNSVGSYLILLNVLLLCEYKNIYSSNDNGKKYEDYYDTFNSCTFDYCISESNTSKHMKKYTLFSILALLSSMPCFSQDAKKGVDSLRIAVTTINKSQPLFILDDVEMVGSDLGTVKPEDVDNINVLKPGRESEHYGEKGKNGVVIITTKKYKAKKAKGNS
jgi:hypothetical protein